MMQNELTRGQKAAATRRQHKAARDAKEMNKRKTAAALETILQDSESSREAKENALFLLANVYGKGAI